MRPRSAHRAPGKAAVHSDAETSVRYIFDTKPRSGGAFFWRAGVLLRGHSTRPRSGERLRTDARTGEPPSWTASGTARMDTVMRLPLKPVARATIAACLLAIGALITSCVTPGGRETTANALDVIIAGSSRTAVDRSRDRYRHPKATLLFFGIRPNKRVLQVWPESGWYTKIVAPLVRAKGRYVAGVIAPDPGSRFLQERSANYRRLLASRPDLYGPVTVVTFPLDGSDVVPPGSVDMVLSFRDLHEWMALGDTQQALATLYRALTPGGVFGVVDNRGKPRAPQDPRAKSGYVRQDYAIR